jgi:GxxExxY protein
MLLHELLTEQIIGAAIEVHREFGPGLLESAYEQCFCHDCTCGFEISVSAKSSSHIQRPEA